MSELSELLKKSREEQKKTIEDVSSDTKIRPIFIENIEKGDLKSLPSYLHAYGFVKKYAEYLGFSYEYVKPFFDSEYPKENVVSAAKENESEITEEEKSGSSLWKVLIVLMFIAAALWFAYTKFYKPQESEFLPSSFSEDKTEPVQKAETENISSAEPNENSSAANLETNDIPAPVIQETGQPSESSDVNTPAVPAILPDTAPAILNTETTPVQNNANDVKHITLSFTDKCWVLFKPDSGRSEEFTSEAGTVKRLNFINSFTLDIGNAAAVTLRYDKQSFKNYGGAGVPAKGIRYSLENGVLKELGR